MQADCVVERNSIERIVADDQIGLELLRLFAQQLMIRSGRKGNNPKPIRQMGDHVEGLLPDRPSGAEDGDSDWSRGNDVFVRGHAIHRSINVTAYQPAVKVKRRASIRSSIPP